MSDHRLERLSALMDGELGDHLAANLLDQVREDSELRCAWERYHLVGQVMRGEAFHPAARRIARALVVALESEPIPMRRPPGRRRAYTRLAPFGGAALAAAAAFLAVFAVPNLFRGPDDETTGRQAASWGPATGVLERRWDLDRPDLASQLDLFLVNHQEAAPATGVKGILPYATLVGYESAR